MEASAGTLPLVTVFLPTLKRPHYLREALRSAVQQTYPNLQIIVSDNGSGDNTPAVVSEFSDRRILFRQNTYTLGVTEHYHQCLSSAQGKYFMLLSDDDTLSPGYVEAMVEVMEKFPGVTAAFGSSCVINSEGEILQSRLLDAVWSESGFAFVRDWLSHKRSFPTFSVVSVFTRTSLARQYGGQPPFVNYSDVAFVIALALAGDVAFSSKGCFYYRKQEMGGCVTMPWEGRLLSVWAFNRYMKGAQISQLFGRYSQEEMLQLRHSIDFGISYSYLSQIYHFHASRMSLLDLSRAILFYPVSYGYLLCLPRFVYWFLRRLPRLGIESSRPQSDTRSSHLNND